MSAARGEYLRLEPQTEMRVSSLRESVWRRIGDLRLAMNDADGALQAFDTVLQSNPQNMAARSQIGAALAKKGSFHEAIQHLERVRVSESDPTCRDLRDDDVLSLLAHCYVMTQQLDRAYQAYSSALTRASDPKDPSLWYGIGLLYDRCGSVENALEAFQAVLNIDPHFHRSDEVCFCIGVIYKEQGKLDESLSYFHRTMNAGPPPHPLTYADSLYQIAHVNELKKDYAVAIETYKKALSHNPRHHRSLQQLGWIQHVIGNNTEATDMLTRATKVNVNDGQAFYLLGRVYMATQEFRKAYDAYQDAVRCDHNNSTYWCSIGVLYYQMQQHTDALDAYTRAIRLNPAVSASWYDLGTLFESCSQPDDAMLAYRRASRLSPRSQQISQRLEKLEQQQPVQPPTMLQHPAAPGQDRGTQSPAIIPPEGRPPPKLPHVTELFERGILPLEEAANSAAAPSTRAAPTYATPAVAPTRQETDLGYNNNEEVVTVSHKVGPGGQTLPETTKSVEYPVSRPIQGGGMDEVRYAQPSAPSYEAQSQRPTASAQRYSQMPADTTQISAQPPRPHDGISARTVGLDETNKDRAAQVIASERRAQSQGRSRSLNADEIVPETRENRIEERQVVAEVSAEMLPKLPSLPPKKPEVSEAPQQGERRETDKDKEAISPKRPASDEENIATRGGVSNGEGRDAKEGRMGVSEETQENQQVAENAAEPVSIEAVSQQEANLGTPARSTADPEVLRRPGAQDSGLADYSAGEENKQSTGVTTKGPLEISQREPREPGQNLSANKGSRNAEQGAIPPHRENSSVQTRANAIQPNGSTEVSAGREKSTDDQENESKVDKRPLIPEEEALASKTPHHVETEDESVSAEEAEVEIQNKESVDKRTSEVTIDAALGQADTKMADVTEEPSNADDVEKETAMAPEAGKQKDANQSTHVKASISKEDSGAGIRNLSSSEIAQAADDDSAKAREKNALDSSDQSKKSPPLLSLPLSRPPRRIPTNKLAGLTMQPGVGLGIGSPSSLTMRGSPRSGPGNGESPLKARPRTPSFRSTPAPKLSPGLSVLRSTPQTEARPIVPSDEDRTPNSCGEKRPLAETPEDLKDREDIKRIKSAEDKGGDEGEASSMKPESDHREEKEELALVEKSVRNKDSGEDGKGGDGNEAEDSTSKGESNPKEAQDASMGEEQSMAGASGTREHIQSPREDDVLPKKANDKSVKS